MKRELAVLPALLLCGACAFGRIKPGLTKDGAAVAVIAASLETARRAAVVDSLELFIAPGSAAAAKETEALGARAGELTGRAQWKAGKGVVEVRFARVLAALDKDGLLRPEGFSAREPRVLLLVSEPQGILDLGVGPAADAIRRDLSARGMTGVDGRDGLNEFLAKGRDPASLARGAARSGADWMLLAAASASADFDAPSGAWRGRANIVGDVYRVSASTPIAQTQSDAMVLDVSSSSARGKALEQAGEALSAKVAAAINAAQGGRSEGAVFVLGGDMSRLKGLIAAVRASEGVAGAYLGVWKGEEEAVVVRVFLNAGMKIDGLAARLLRRDSSLTLVSVEPDDGRLSVELPERGEP